MGAGQLESLFKALSKPGMFVKKKNVEYGPLWAGTNDKTLARVIKVINEWFGMIYLYADEWWNMGADEGGGLAMNDGVAICIDVLKSVFEHLSGQGITLVQLTDDELIKEIEPFGETLGRFFAGLSPEEKNAFRSGARGTQGQTAMRIKCEKALHDNFENFKPPGLIQAIELQEKRTNQDAFVIIEKIEKALKSIIVETLETEYDNNRKAWWYDAIPPKIRTKCDKRLDEEQGEGEKEDYFDLIDMREIGLKNWTLFQEFMSFSKKGKKEEKTKWIVKLNDMRKIVMHPAKEQFITFDQLELLKEYQEFVANKYEGKDD